MEEITGYIEHIIFASIDTGFTVAKLKEKQKKEFTTICGILPFIKPGETLTCFGDWLLHPSYGKQFEVKNYSTKIPSDVLGIQKYLESGLVKGIGPVFAEKIVELFGENTLDIIDHSPHRLLEIEGIGEKKLEWIKISWEEHKAIRQVMIFLRSYDVSPAYAQKIFKKYGDRSIEKVKENPYQLAKDIFGIGFKIADNIAEKLGIEKNSPKRIEAGIEFSLWEVANNGHTCYPEKAFVAISEKILEVEKDIIENILHQMIKENKIIRKNLSNGEEEHSFISLLFFHCHEEGIKTELERLLFSSSYLREVKLEKALSWIQEKMSLSLEEKQSSAIKEALTKKVHVITGGPGTGKSTITKAILYLTKELTSRIILAAPTGRAAKRMAEITRKKAFTIHALLEFDFSTQSFKKNRNNPLSCDLIIIDEASMIDTSLMYNLLLAIPAHARLILIGDVDQLPSVGPGNVLKDIIASSICEVTRLTEIFRQCRGSKIILNAHNINEGKMPHLTQENRSDFLFIEKKIPEDILPTILSLVSEELPKNKGFDPLDDIQVLSPMKRGIIGIEYLNQSLQNILNPSSSPFFHGGKCFHNGDKVMQIRNNYNKEVYNGDIGKICDIDLSEQVLSINFDGKTISYDFNELDEIVLAYAVSVHKYQGSECPCIILPIHICHFKLLFRNLLYTAITRGKKHVILVGTKQAIAIAIKNNHAFLRYTGLKKTLKNISFDKIKPYEMLLPGFK